MHTLRSLDLDHGSAARLPCHRHRGASRSSRPEPGAYAAAQNGRELMQSLAVLLDQQPSLQPPAQALRAKLLAALH